MKNRLQYMLTAAALFVLQGIASAQAPNLGSTAGFALFSSNGAVSNIGISHVTGNVGTNSGSSTAFGNVNGVMHDNDGASAACAADLLTLYGQLNGMIPTLFPSTLLGNGDTLNAGIYSISSAATLNSVLLLNAQGDPNALFVFKVQGAFSANTSSKIKLINGALACNVFWKIEGLVSIASGVSMKGTMIANNAAINTNTGDTLEGRAFSINGAVTVDGILVYTPVGCGSPLLTGPGSPNLASTECYALFSSDGPVTNSGITFATGDVGTNNGLTTGFNSLNITGNIHPIPDVSTSLCATDLLNVYNYLNTLPFDIELLYPAQFGNNLVLTPHTYQMNGAATFMDTLYFDAQGNANAVFVIKLNGALSTSANAKVILINGAQANNVFWKVEGAVDINNYSVFNGNIICNNGAINLNTGVILNGRAFTTTGSLTSMAISANKPGNCQTIPTGIVSEYAETKMNVAIVYPNPFSGELNFTMKEELSALPYHLLIYNGMGIEVMNVVFSEHTTKIKTDKLPNGIYFYQIMSQKKVQQSGKLVSGL